MTYVMACIDNSPSTLAVCDYAAWASLRLSAPLTLLHVLDEDRYPVSADLSGNIGLGSREHLLKDLAALDAQRAKLALEHGQHMLETARDRTVLSGAALPDLKQRHGDLVDTLTDLNEDIRLLVIGRAGGRSARDPHALGGQVESVIRAFHQPILIANNGFKKPEKIMLAFDGSATSHNTVKALASSPIFTGLSLHVVMVGKDSADNQSKLAKARSTLAASGLEVNAELIEGDVETVLQAYQTEQDIDLLVMGAYGHSRIRNLLVGSTTTTMLQTTALPVLLLR
ncbi:MULTISPECIES: universal stress protein [unclassified Pseudomonas]|uniref:universal stress protein n=1 Tax=Pseudomonas TaxID=286 RepID=UPI00083966F2|nr:MULTISPECIES: universal stress protein [unclassified Pseudomonas]MBJ2221682.1 universal stress protein [Pseudomonas sp. MF7453]QIH07734.1 universal stress protein [Pseudomonas sp. BIOMIG1BAC]